MLKIHVRPNYNSLHFLFKFKKLLLHKCHPCESVQEKIGSYSTFFIAALVGRM